MQNPATGAMEKLSSAQFDKIEDMLKEANGSVTARYTEIKVRKPAVKTGVKFRDGSEVPPDVAKFTEGEELTINGATFYLAKISKRGLYLRGISRPFARGDLVTTSNHGSFRVGKFTRRGVFLRGVKR